MGANTIVYVLVRSEVGILAEGDSHILELIEKVTTYDIGGHTPEIVLDTVIWGRERPSHLHLDGTILLDFPLDCVRVRLEHEKRRNGYIRAGPIVGHDGLRGLARRNTGCGDTVLVRAEACCVRNDYAGSTGALRISDLHTETGSKDMSHLVRIQNIMDQKYE
jgi:hypothetical protein